MRDALREAAFGREHPARERARRDGECARFADAENKADGDHRRGVPGGGGEGGEDTPPGDDDCKGAARSEFIAEPGARDLEKREAHAIAGENPADGDERESEFLADDGQCRRDDGAVHVGDHVDRYSEGQHYVTSSGGPERLALRRRRSGGFWGGGHHRRGRSEGAS